MFSDKMNRNITIRDPAHHAPESSNQGDTIIQNTNMFQFSVESNRLGYFSNSNSGGSVGGQDGQSVGDEMG